MAGVGAASRAAPSGTCVASGTGPARLARPTQGGLHRDRPASIIFQEVTLIIGRRWNMSSDRLENPVRPAADRFLVLLKTRGPQTAADLGKATGVTGEAARQQLVRLAAEGLVVATAEPRGAGRPAPGGRLPAPGPAPVPH